MDHLQPETGRPLPPPEIHEHIIHLKGVEIPIRQIAIRNIGHEHPTLLITNDLATPPTTSSAATPNA